MALVLFTNTLKEAHNKDVWINPDKIISVFSMIDPQDKKKKKLVTAIFAGGDLTWTVKEELSVVVSKINHIDLWEES
tara:strand:- start:4671 stop:4901 length:231 start_codon:yes stop_codon:yes gene_type:complete